MKTLRRLISLIVLLCFAFILKADTSPTVGKIVSSPKNKGVLAVFPSTTSYEEYMAKNSLLYSHLRENKKYAFLKIATTPAGAQVVVNGKSLGSTPLAVKAEPGEYSIRVTLPGHKPIREIVQLAAGTAKDLIYTLGVDPLSSGIAPIPSEALRTAVSTNETADFEILSLTRDKIGSLFLAYKVNYGIKYPREVSYISRTFDPGEGSANVTAYGLAVSFDNGASWIPKAKSTANEQFEEKVFKLKKLSNSGNLCDPTFNPIPRYIELVYSDRVTYSDAYIHTEPNPQSGVAVTLLHTKGMFRHLIRLETCERVWRPTSTSAQVTAEEISEFGLSQEDLQLTKIVSENKYITLTDEGPRERNVLPLPSPTLFPDSVATKGNKAFYVIRNDGKGFNDFTYSIFQSDDRLSSYNIASHTQQSPISGMYRYGNVSLASSKADELFVFDHDYVYNYQSDTKTFKPFAELIPLKYTFSNSSYGGVPIIHTPPVSYAFDADDEIHISFKSIKSGVAETYYRFVPTKSRSYDKIYLFTSSECTRCDDIRSYLTSQGKSFGENLQLDESLMSEVKAKLAASGYPLLVVSAGTKNVFLEKPSKIQIDKELGISFPHLVHSVSSNGKSLRTRIFLDGKTPKIVTYIPDGLALFRGDSDWEKIILFSRSDDSFHDIFRDANHGYWGEDLQVDYNEISSDDDIEFVGMDPYQNADGPYRPTYKLYSTRLRASVTSRFEYTGTLDSSLPYIAFVDKNRPFVFTTATGNISFDADRPTFVVSNAEHCGERKNCVVFSDREMNVSARLKGGAAVQVQDTSNLIKRLKIEPITDESELYFIQSRQQIPRTKVTVKFSKDATRSNCRLTFCLGTLPEVIKGMTITGDLTALNADIDFSSFQNDYEAEKQRISSVLSKKAYLIMNNKRFRSYQSGLLEYITEHELVYLLREAESVASREYDEAASTGINISKSQYARMYFEKDGTNPQGNGGLVSALITGGATNSAPMVLMRPKLNHYIPGDDYSGHAGTMASLFIDRDGDLVSFNHIFAVIALQDIEESEIQNTWRSMGYSWIGDRGFALAYLWGGTVAQSELYSSALTEAPLDEIIADFYVLTLRKAFRSDHKKRLSAALESFFGSADQQRDKFKALSEVNFFGF